METSINYRPLRVGEIRQQGDQHRKKRNKVWRDIGKGEIGSALSKRVAKIADYRRPKL